MITTLLVSPVTEYLKDAEVEIVQREPGTRLMVMHEDKPLAHVPLAVSRLFDLRGNTLLGLTRDVPGMSIVYVNDLYKFRLS